MFLFSQISKLLLMHGDQWLSSSNKDKTYHKGNIFDFIYCNLYVFFYNISIYIYIYVCVRNRSHLSCILLKSGSFKCHSLFKSGLVYSMSTLV